MSVSLSDNEPYGAVEDNKEHFEQGLGARVTVLHDKGHFTEDDGVTELPELLSLI